MVQSNNDTHGDQAQIATSNIATQQTAGRPPQGSATHVYFTDAEKRQIEAEARDAARRCRSSGLPAYN